MNLIWLLVRNTDGQNIIFLYGAQEVTNNKSEITNNKPIFSQYNIFYNYEYFFFFNLRFDLFLIIAKEVNQIRSNVVCVVARRVFVFCCALTPGRCNAFQNIFVN